MKWLWTDALLASPDLARSDLFFGLTFFYQDWLC